MTLTDRLLATIIGGLALWIMTRAITYFVKRSRIRGALLADIHLHLDGCRDQSAAVTKLAEDHLKEGVTLPFPIAYNVGDYSLYKALLKDLSDYLNKSEVVKVVKFYQALWEMDVSINGLASTLGKWEEEKVSLSAEQVKHAKRRVARISSYAGALTVKDIRSLNDLPNDYRSIKGAETVVEKT